jgi:hypothetical protein
MRNYIGTIIKSQGPINGCAVIALNDLYRASQESHGTSDLLPAQMLLIALVHNDAAIDLHRHYKLATRVTSTFSINLCR